jgi:hypothetical protein
MITPLLLLLGPGPQPLPGPVHPKLVVVITVDQMRPDYLDRWKRQFTGGLATLTTGALFLDAYQDHAVTETAPGHASILSGRWPAHTGIMRNDAGVNDPNSPLLDVKGAGASPMRFRGTAFFDWLQRAEPDARALSVSRKDRGAILPLGRARQSVYWYQSGIFTTSRYYADTLPAWVKRFNALRVPFRLTGAAWRLLLPDSAYTEPDSQPWEHGGTDFLFPHVLPTDTAKNVTSYGGLITSPMLDSLTLAFALDGLDALRLGKGSATDLLAVSLSSTDAIGHTYGPDSREMHDQILRLDRSLGWFLAGLFDRYGRGNVIVVLTADHGVTPYPEVSRQRGHADARWVDIDTVIASENLRIGRALGDTTRAWLNFDTGILFLQDNGRFAASGLNGDSLVRGVARRIRAVTGVARVDRPADLAGADTTKDAVARRWIHHLTPDAGVALVVTLAEWNVWGDVGGSAEHGQPSDLDAHIPLLFWGKGIRSGRNFGRADAVDIAPTLARLLGISPLSVPDGRVLQAALDMKE